MSSELPIHFVRSSISLNCKAIPKDNTIEGTIRLATVVKKRTLEPQNFFLNANPAATDKTTVKIITIIPKIMDLLKAEPISTTDPPRQSSSNQ